MVMPGGEAPEAVVSVRRGNHGSVEFTEVYKKLRAWISGKLEQLRRVTGARERAVVSNLRDYLIL
jgi:hypothetical protein